MLQPLHLLCCLALPSLGHKCLLALLRLLQLGCLMQGRLMQGCLRVGCMQVGSLGVGSLGVGSLRVGSPGLGSVGVGCLIVGTLLQGFPRVGCLMLGCNVVLHGSSRPVGISLTHSTGLTHEVVCTGEAKVISKGPPLLVLLAVLLPGQDRIRQPRCC